MALSPLKTSRALWGAGRRGNSRIEGRRIQCKIGARLLLLPAATGDPGTSGGSGESGGGDKPGSDGTSNGPHPIGGGGGAGDRLNCYTANATREEVDLEVWGSPGQRPLRWVRNHNTRQSYGANGTRFGQAGNWRFNYQYAIVGSSPGYGINMPDATTHTFNQQSNT